MSKAIYDRRPVLPPPQAVAREEDKEEGATDEARIGKTHTATVIRSVLDGREVAIKCKQVRMFVDRRTCPAAEQLDHAMIEVEASASVQGHRGVTELLGVYRDAAGTMLYLAFECMRGGDLWKMIRDRKGVRLPVDALRPMMRQLLEALAHIHDRCGRIHGDIKPGNILLGEGNRLAFCDFMCALPPLQCNLGNYTHVYRAPEAYINHFADGPPADIWALGAVFAELTLCRTEVFGMAGIRVDERAQTAPPPDHAGANMILACRNEQVLPRLRTVAAAECPPLYDLIAECMLAPDPAARPRASALLAEHPFFK